MGFIKAAVGSAVAGFQQAQFKEFIKIPEGTPNEVLAILGDITYSENNKPNGLISDGSKIIVPQGYIALMLNDGKIFDVADEPGTYIWSTGENGTFFTGEGFINGVQSGLKSTWSMFKDRFAHGDVLPKVQKVIYIKTQPIIGLKFGSQGDAEFMSATYRNLSIRFYGQFDLQVDDYLKFFIDVVSNKLVKGMYSLKDIEGTLRANITAPITVGLTKYARDNSAEVPEMNCELETVSSAVARTISQRWNDKYGLKVPTLVLQDISYTPESKAKVEKWDEKLIYANGMNMLNVENQLARNEAMKNAAANEGAGGSGMNMFVGMGMGQAIGGMMGQGLAQAPMYNQQSQQQMQVAPQSQPVVQQSVQSQQEATKEADKPNIPDNLEPVLDENGEIIGYKVKKKRLPIFDDDGNIIGYV